MNKKVVSSLAVGAALILLLAGLYYFSAGTAPKTGPSPVTAPGAPSDDGAAQAENTRGHTHTAHPPRAAGCPRH